MTVPPLTDAQALGHLVAPAAQFDQYVIQPWTLKQLIQVAPILDTLAGELENRGITFEALVEMTDSQVMPLMLGLIRCVLPQLPEFLAISLRTEAEALADLSLSAATQLVVRIVSLNFDEIKNAFGLVMGSVTQAR